MECPAEPTELDFQFHNNEPRPLRVNYSCRLRRRLLIK